MKELDNKKDKSPILTLIKKALLFQVFRTFHLFFIRTNFVQFLPAMADITFGYWTLRGLAEPIRYLLHYKNVKFEDKRYLPDGSWEKDKFNLGLDFPNLPYYFEGKIKLTQSLTILRYLAKKYSLEGNTEEDQLRVSLVEQQIIDFSNAFFHLIFLPDFEQQKPDFLKKASYQLKLLSDFLGKRKFLAGDYVTYVDFIAFDNFDFHVMFSKTVLDEFPNLKEYQERIRNLPGLKQYLHSPTYVAWPIAGPSCAWGGGGEMPK